MHIILIAAFVAMSIFQIFMFVALPRFLRNILACLPLLGIIVNFLFSGVILFFTGVGMIAGVSNVGASVVFTIYIFIYRKKWEPSIRLEWRRKLIFSYPVLAITDKTTRK